MGTQGCRLEGAGCTRWAFPSGVMQYMARLGHYCCKQRFSADLTIFAKEGVSSKGYPALRSLLIRRSSLSLSRMVVKLHHTSEAYRGEAMVVARDTSWSCCCRGA